MNKMKLIGIAASAALMSGIALADAKNSISAIADRVDCLYAVGDAAEVTFTVKDAKGALCKSGEIKLRVDNFGETVVTNATFDLAKGNPFKIMVSRDKPGFLRFTADKFVYGIGFGVDRIMPGTPNVADFETFWRDAIAKYDREIPAKIESKVDESLCDKDWIVERVTMAAPCGRKVYGFVAKERNAKGRLPGRVEISAAGYGSWSQAPTKTKGMVTLKMTVYPFEPDPKLGKRAEYDALNAAAKARWGVPSYCDGGISESREAYFYYPVILANNRAIDWFAKREDVMQGNIDYMGTSQGGGLGLAAMALNRNFSRGCVFVPALTDLLGSKSENRRSGWSQLLDAHPKSAWAAVEKNAPYFCGVNFARMVRVPIRFCVGYADQTCPPNAVYSAFNVCGSPDKAIIGGIGMGHGVFWDYYEYLDAWSRAQSVKKSAYRFLAFNIWGPYFGNPVEERAGEIAATVKKWNPDVAGFQEMHPDFWKSSLVGALSDEYAIIGRGIGFEGLDVHTPLLYRRSRFDLVDSGVVLQCPELDDSKGAVWAVLKDKATGKKIVAFASHAWWRYDGIGDDWIRLNGAKMLCAKMKEISAKYDAAVIGGGDLNAPVTSSSLKYMIDQGFADAQKTAAISPSVFPTEHNDPVRCLKGNYVGRNGANGHCLARESSRYLDHVFYDPKKMTVNRFDIDISEIACRISDHHPIIADFDL